MSILEAFILGIVEGLTEFLPVSSTGHLLLTQRIMGIPSGEAADAFTICIQVGAILAVVGIYRKHVWEMMQGVVGRNADGWHLATRLLAAFIPAAALGFVLEKTIKKYLFAGDTWGLWPIVGAWFLGGVVILLVTYRRKASANSLSKGLSLESLTFRMAVIVGVAQCLAMWPGVSRSLITIVGGVLVGLSLPAAVEFSFLLGVLTLSAATAYDFLKHGEAMVQTLGWPPLIVGMLAAWGAAFFAVKWMVGYLNTHSMAIFGWYRVVLAIAVAAWLMSERW